MNKIVVKDLIINIREDEFRSLTDIARYRNNEDPRFIIQNWMKNFNTFEFLTVWEEINNSNFKRVHMDTFRITLGSNYFTMTPEKWINSTNAIGIAVRRGRYGGGTYAHKDIAFEFASWISPEFKLYLIVEYQRLKEKESKSLEWSVSRELSKINYKVHANAISKYIVPTLTEEQIRFVYASEADMLNVSLFGVNAKEWRESNKDKEGIIQSMRLVKLNEIEKYIHYYNNKRITVKLKGLTPVQYRNQSLN